MSFSDFERKLRISQRSDISWSLLHMTKDQEGMPAYDVLKQILKDEHLVGSNTNRGFIVGTTPAVCFQDVPIRTFCQNTLFEMYEKKTFRSTKEKYGFFGFLFQKNYVFQKGGRPVIYEKTETAKAFLPNTEWWRIVNLDLTKKDDVVDWTHEREWRIPNTFKFELHRVTVLVETTKDYNKLIEDLPDLPRQVAGIIPLEKLF